MLLLPSTTDKLQLITSSTSAIDVTAHYVDGANTTAVPNGMNRQLTAIVTATTTDIVASPGGSTARNIRGMTIRNKGAAANDVTVVYDASGTDFELFKTTLLPGETLQYFSDIGFLKVASSRLDRWLRTTAAVVNATTAFADITGLTVAVENGKTYNFEAMLIHANDAATTGSRFAINGPTLTNIFAGTIDTVTPSVTASAHSAGVVTAVDTAITAQTTGSTSNRLAIISGVFTAGANGTFAMRLASEVAVANGVTVRAGSWLHVWEQTT